MLLGGTSFRPPHKKYFMGRIAKIARLPESLCEQVNQRLLNSEPARSIAAWFNALPEVQALLQSEFDGRPVSELNLYHWRDGGLQQCLAEQDAMDAITKLRSDAAGLDAASDLQLPQKLGVCLTARVAVALRRMDEDNPNYATQLKRPGHLCANLGILRRADRLANQAELDCDTLALYCKNSLLPNPDFVAASERTPPLKTLRRCFSLNRCPRKNPTVWRAKSRPTSCNTSTIPWTGLPGGTKRSPARSRSRNRFFSASVTPPATGAMSWSGSLLRTNRSRRF
jgi:hypothetical protein